jgi:predicted phage terminase large subunit-like protein
MWNETKEKEFDNLLFLDSLDKSRENLLQFTKNTLDGFEVEPYHKAYYTLLDAFAKGDIKRLIVTMPPQHGKSEGSTRRLPAYMLGLKPSLKIAIASYNSTFASKFNRDTQRIIDDKFYSEVFPDTKLMGSIGVKADNNYLRNTSEFEIVGETGGLKSVGRGGALTGSKVDVMIMDDLYKDYMEANSPIIRESVWDWYTTVVDSRLHNDSQQLIVFTRWHEEDLIGRLEALGKVKTITDINDINTVKLKHDEWFKVNFEAIKEGEKTPIDDRETGEPLWSSVHSKESLLSTMEMDVEKFNCLYQGNPESKEGLLYTKFKTYEELPELKQIKNYTDTADTGQDYLCSIVYGIALAPTDKHLYILDILYTDKPMEETEPMTIDLLKRNKVNIANIESNNGGRGFARVVDKGADGTHVQWFHQSNNKEARIFSNSATVNNKIVFPKDWFLRFPKFYSDVTKYKKLFKANKFDDAPDTLTGIVEKEDIPAAFTF